MLKAGLKIQSKSGLRAMKSSICFQLKFTSFHIRKPCQAPYESLMYMDSGSIQKNHKVTAILKGWNMKSLKLRILLIIIVFALCIYSIHARPLNFGMDIQGGTHLEMIVDTEHIPQDKTEAAIEGVQRVLQSRIDEFIITESSIQRGHGNRLIVQIPGIDTKKALMIKKALIPPAFLEFKLVIKGPEYFGY